MNTQQKPGIEMFEDSKLEGLDNTEKERLLESIRLCSMRMPDATEDDYSQIQAAYFPLYFSPVKAQGKFAVRLFQLQAVHANIRGLHAVVIAGTSSGKSSCIPIYWYYVRLQMYALHEGTCRQLQKDPKREHFEEPIAWDVVPTHLLMRSQATSFRDAGLTCAVYEPGNTSPDGQTETQVSVHADSYRLLFSSIQFEL
jgi:hypothetical protein